jgi:hypothetical protein
MATIRISSNNFAKGIKYAKQVGGKFDSMSKTWTLPDTQRVADMLNAPGAYGWVVAKPANIDIRTVEGAMALEDC